MVYADDLINVIANPNTDSLLKSTALEKVCSNKVYIYYLFESEKIKSDVKLKILSNEDLQNLIDLHSIANDIYLDFENDENVTDFFEALLEHFAKKGDMPAIHYLLIKYDNSLNIKETVKKYMEYISDEELLNNIIENANCSYVKCFAQERLENIFAS